MTQHASTNAGFLAFLRLIGTIYFKKYASGFDTQSPSSYFKRFINPIKSVREQHTQWIDSIRDNIWSRTKFENQMIPSTDALYLHWKRTCWIMHMWNQADKNTITLIDMEQFGWKIIEEQLTIVWTQRRTSARSKHEWLPSLKAADAPQAVLRDDVDARRRTRYVLRAASVLIVKTWSNQTQQV